MRVLWTVLTAVAVYGCSSSELQAQAWVPSKGDGTVSVTYQNYDVAGHYDAMGHKNNNGGTQSHAVIAEVDYGLTDAIGLTASLPFVSSKYTGPPVYFVGGLETHPGPLDDGDYHGALQDLHLAARWLFWLGTIPVAPFIAATLPTHDYETAGEAVPGRHRRDVQIGASAGANLDRLRTGAYVDGRYGYTATEKTDGFPFTHSNIDLEIGWPVRSHFLLRGLTAWQIRHQGPSVHELTADWENHDRFIAPNYTNLGAGVSVPVAGADVYALYLGTAAGSNGAHRQRTIAAGVTFGFSSRLTGLGGAPAAISQLQVRSRSRFRQRR